MDDMKVFGVQQAIGKAVAKQGPPALERLRAQKTFPDFMAFLRDLPSALPSKLKEEYLAIPTQADWEKHKAKIVLASKVALGTAKVVHAHEDPFAQAEQALRAEPERASRAADGSGTPP